MRVLFVLAFFLGIQVSTLSQEALSPLPWASFVIEGKSVFISREGQLLSDQQEELQNLEKIIIIRGFSQAQFETLLNKPDRLIPISDLMSSLFHLFPQSNFQLSYLGYDQWVVYRDDELPIFMGPLDRLDEKLLGLKKFFKYYNTQQDRQRLDKIDCRIPHRILVTYGKE